MGKNILVMNAGVYFLLFGEIGEKAMLLNCDSNEIVVCQILESKTSWHHGEYFFNFEDAYKYYKEGVK